MRAMHLDVEEDGDRIRLSGSLIQIAIVSSAADSGHIMSRGIRESGRKQDTVRQPGIRGQEIQTMQSHRSLQGFVPERAVRRLVLYCWAAWGLCWEACH